MYLVNGTSVAPSRRRDTTIFLRVRYPHCSNGSIHFGQKTPENRVSCKKGVKMVCPRENLLARPVYGTLALAASPGNRIAAAAAQC